MRSVFQKARVLLPAVAAFCLAASGQTVRQGQQGQRYALLVGIGQYPQSPTVHSLEGPAHDIEAIDRLLIQRFGYRPENVTVLRDAQATRRGIVAAFEQLAAKARLGDYVFIYYSGHGTSPQDPSWRVPLPVEADTGALIPSDFHTGRTPRETSDSLVVGRRDLRPSLEKLDSVATVFALFDTCFSQNLAREVVLKHRGVPRSPSLEEDYAGDIKAAEQQAPAAPYPYRNVTWVSAALAGQQAVDLDSDVLKDNPKATFDGQPHGQFTNAVVQALSGAADLNGDGSITNRELFQYLSGRATREQWSHQPALSADESNPARLDSPVLGGVRPAKPEAPATPAPGLGSGVSARLSPVLRIAVDTDVPATLQRRLAAIPGVEIATQNSQLTVRQEPDGLRIYQYGGLPLSDEPMDDKAILDRVRVEPKLRSLVGLTYARPTATLELSLRDVTSHQRLRQGVLFPGNRFSLFARSDRPVWPLVVNIDHTGFVTVLYPSQSQTPGPVRGEVDLGAEGVQCPCGIEQFKVLLFESAPPGYADWAGRGFPADSPLMDQLLALAKQGAGETSFHFLSNSLPAADR
jgi:uncharacterized caspase-like protein